MKKAKILAGIAGVLVGLFVALVAAASWESRFAEPYNHSVGPSRIWPVLRRSNFVDAGMCVCGPDQEVSLRRDDGQVVPASLFRPESGFLSSGIVVVHGNTAMGRKLAMYPILASQLAEQGFVVLTLDLPQFGESPDPLKIGTLAAHDGLPSVAAAARYLINEAGATRGLTVIGHSMGAIAALDAGISIDQVRRIVLMGGPRRQEERMADPEQVEYFRRRHQETHLFIYGSELPDWYMNEVWFPRNNRGYESYLDYFSEPGHKPVMLVDGELEPEVEHAFFEQFYEEISGPKKLVRLQRADHYCNTAQSLGLKFYDSSVLSQLVSEMLTWFDELDTT